MMKTQWYTDHINSKKVALPIKVYPPLMLDKESAFREYDRLYEVFCTLYKSMMRFYIEEKDHDIPLAESITLEFLSKVNDEYLSLCDTVQEYNDEEMRRMCALDTSDLKTFIATLHRAKKIEVQWQSDGTSFRILGIKAIDKTKNSDSLNSDGGVNDMLFNDIVSKLDGLETKLTPSHRKWAQYQKVISECVAERMYFDTDVRTIKKELAKKCRNLYDLIMSEPECLPKTQNQSDEAVSMLVRILDINISEEEKGRLKELIQGKK